MGHEVVIEELERAGRHAGLAAEDAARVDPSNAVKAVDGALPGARSAGLATGVADALGKRIAAWADQLRGYADDLSSAASLYRTNEHRAEEDLRVIADPAGRARPI